MTGSKLVPLSDKGRVIGENHHRAKLTDAQIDKIRALYEEGVAGAGDRLGYRRLAKMFGVHRATIQHIVNDYRRNGWADSFKRVDK